MDDGAAERASTPIIDYVLPTTPKRVLKPRSIQVAASVLCVAIVVPAIGIGILIGFIWTNIPQFVEAGLIWVGVGGLLTLVLLVASFIQVSLNRPGKNDSKIKKIYGFAIAAAVSAFLVAFICARLGVDAMVSPYFKVSVFNDSKAPIQSVTVLFDGGDITVGPLNPNARETSTYYRLHHGAGPLIIRVSAGGKTATRTDQVYCDDKRLGSGSLEVHVESKELP